MLGTFLIIALFVFIAFLDEKLKTIKSNRDALLGEEWDFTKPISKK